MNCLKFILCVLFLAFGTASGWASAAATLTNHNLIYFQIDALPTAIPTNVIMLTGNLTNWQKLVTNVICNPCLTINPTDTIVPYRINATTFGDSLLSYQDDATMWMTATHLSNDAHFALRSTGTNCGSGFYSISLSDSSGIQDVVWLNGLKGGTWGAGTPATRSGVFSINTLYHNAMYERFEIDGNLGTIKMFDKTGVQNFQLSDVSGYTGTGTNYLSDDGTYKPCCALSGPTINPSDTYVPYRVNATTFGDSWWYYLANGIGIDTNIFFGPGTTNQLYRSGNDMVYTNSASDVKWLVKNSSGTTAGIEAQGIGTGLLTVSGTAPVAGLRANVDQVGVGNGEFSPGTDLGENNGSMARSWSTTVTSNMVVRGNYGPSTTNWVRMFTAWSQPDQAFSIDIQSLTNNVAGPGFGLKFKTNSVPIFHIPTVMWVDSMVPQSAVRNGATAPTTAAFNGGPATTLMFQNNRDDTVEFSVQLNHNYKQGTDISPHVHWCETAATGAGTNVVWELTYTWQNVNAAFGAYATLTSTNYVTTTNWFHQLSGFPHIAGSGKTVSSILVCQLRRLANSATADDYDQNVAFLGCDIHYQVDSPGSDSELSKSF